MDVLQIEKPVTPVSLRAGSDVVLTHFADAEKAEFCRGGMYKTMPPADDLIFAGAEKAELCRGGLYKTKPLPMISFSPAQRIQRSCGPQIWPRMAEAVTVAAEPR